MAKTKIFSSSKGDDLPKEVTDLIGKILFYNDGKTKREVLCIGAKKAVSIIHDMTTGENRKSVKYLVKPIGSSRSIWTTAFPYGEPF